MATPSVGSVFAGHRLDAIAGRGGMGIVYRATDLRLERTVALKLIAPEFSGDDAFRRRFRRESQTAASIRHPHVITIFHAGEEEGLLFVTMDSDYRRFLSTSGQTEEDLVYRVKLSVLTNKLQDVAGQDKRALDAFVAEFERRYRAATWCATGYIIDRCANGPPLKAGTAQ